MKRTMLLILALLLCVAPVIARAEAPQKALTVMVYMCGSNLESQYGCASADINEIAFSGVDTDRLNVLVMTGGAYKWHNGLDAAQIQLGKLKGTQLMNRSGDLDPEVLKLSMGDPEALRQLIAYGVERCPAERYALVLWDHGAGPLEGMCYDEINEPDRLSLGELTQALADAPLPGKLSWIGFDACLMSSVEVASKLSPYAEYMIASQEREPGTGWDYSFLGGLDPEEDGAATGRRIVDAFQAFPRRTPADLTMACIDLSAVAEVEAGLDAMYEKLASDLKKNNFSELSRKRLSATSFGKSVQSGAASGGYDLVDIVSLSNCLADGNEESAKDVLRIRKAVDQAVVYHDENIDDCCGLSVYHPYRNRQKYISRWGGDFSALDFCDGYSKYVSAYGDIMAGDRMVLWNDLTDIRAFSDADAGNDGATVTLRISDEQAANFASARLVVLARNIFDEADDAYFQVYSSADVAFDGSALSADYGGKTLQILDESGMDTLTGSVSYRVTESGTYLLDLYPVEADGSRWDRPIIAEYEPDEAGRLVLKGYSVYDALTGAYTTRADIDLSDFSGISFVNDYRLPTANGDGEWLPFEQWASDPHREVQWRAGKRINRTAFMPSFGWDPSRTEDLVAAYEITDTQGNVFLSDRVPLTQGSVQYVSSQNWLGDGVPDLKASLYSSWDERQISLILRVQNLSEKDQFYMFTDASVNGEPAERVWGVIQGGTGSLYGDGGLVCLAPGEVGWIRVDLDEDRLEGLDPGDRLRRIEGTLIVFGNDPEGTDYWMGVSAEPDVPMDAIFHDGSDAVGDDLSLDDLPLAIIAQRENDLTELDSRVILQPASRAANSRILVNVIVRNGGEGDLTFGVRDVKLNGVPVSVEALSAQGTGAALRSGRFSLAPGERQAASIVLNYDAISAIAPDASLYDISYKLALIKVDENGVDAANVFPMDISVDVPLDCFYDDAETLPSQDLVELGRLYDGLDAESAQALFSNGACEVSLQGVFVEGRDFVLLLRCENHSESRQRIFLGQATLDGQPATMGQRTGSEVYARNGRVRSLCPDREEWQAEPGVSLTLAPGATAYRYVSVRPGSEAQNEARSVAFGAYMYPTEDPLNYTWFDAAGITAAEPAELREGVEQIVPKADLTFRPGQPVVEENDVGLFRDAVLVPEGDLAAHAVPLEIAAPEGEQITNGYYVLLRHVRSDAELAGMNILNAINRENKTAEVSFADGREWVMLDAYGPLTVSEDGSAATATFPGLRAVVRAGEDILPLTFSQIATAEDGRLTFTQVMNRLLFRSEVFPGAILNLATGNLCVALDPVSGEGELVSAQFASLDEPSSALRGLVEQDVWLLHADADSEAYIQLISGDAETTQTQLLQMDGLQLQLAIEPIDNPEDYDVVFYYRNSAGEAKCTRPRPLNSWLTTSD